MSDETSETRQGTCWIDGRETTVASHRTLIGTTVDTCADGQGCDTPQAEPPAPQDDDADEA